MSHKDQMSDRTKIIQDSAELLSRTEAEDTKGVSQTHIDETIEGLRSVADYLEDYFENYKDIEVS